MDIVQRWKNIKWNICDFWVNYYYWQLLVVTRITSCKAICTQALAELPIHRKTNSYYSGTHKLRIKPMCIRHPLTRIKHGTQTKKYLHLPSEFQHTLQVTKSWLYITCNILCFPITDTVYVWNKVKCQLDATRGFYWCILSSTCFGYIRPSSGA